jgi:hypothetical protein
MNRATSLAAASAFVLLFAGAARAQDAGAPPPPPPPGNTTPPPANTGTATTQPPPASAQPQAASSSSGSSSGSASQDEGGQRPNGFVFETHFYGQFVALNAGVGSANLPLLVGGIYGGYKLDRLIIGLGFDFTSYDAPGSGGAQIEMHWVPGIRYAFVRSSDDRVELFGQADLGFGHRFYNNANEIITADLGIGARYWVHKQFAVSAVGGWTGDWDLTQPPSPVPSQSAVLQGIFAGIQLLGVF